MILAEIKDWFDWYSTDAVVSGLKWASIIGLIVVGFLGTFLPVLPGTTLIFAGVLAHYFLNGMEESNLTWISLVAIGLIWVVTMIVDWFSGAIGAKWFGSSKWGVVGAIIGGIVGLFFSLPGLVIGPILGVFIAEILFAKKKFRPAANSTMGTVVGGLAGLFAKVILAIAMVGWYFADVFLVN